MISFLLAAASLAAPPQATLDTLGEALNILEDPTRVSSLRVVTTAVHSKPNGEDEKREHVGSAVRNTAEGRQVEVVEHTRPHRPSAHGEGAQRGSDRGARMAIDEVVWVP